MCIANKVVLFYKLKGKYIRIYCVINVGKATIDDFIKEPNSI